MARYYFEENLGCLNCGIIEAFTGNFCSKECEEEYKNKQLKKQLTKPTFEEELS